MSKKRIPERVKIRREKLRDDGRYEGLTWVPNWVPSYTYTPDLELDAIMEKASGDGSRALQMWYAAVKPRLLNMRGVHLIPGPLQEILGLSLRQLYIDKEIDAVCRVDAENSHYGRVATRLI